MLENPAETRPYVLLLFETESVAEDDLELLSPLSLPPEGWDWKCGLPQLVLCNAGNQTQAVAHARATCLSCYMPEV